MSMWNAETQEVDKIKQTVIWMVQCGWGLADVLGAFEASSDECARIRDNWEEWEPIGIERRENRQRV